MVPFGKPADGVSQVFAPGTPLSFNNQRWFLLSSGHPPCLPSRALGGFLSACILLCALTEFSRNPNRILSPSCLKSPTGLLCLWKNSKSLQRVPSQGGAAGRGRSK